MNNISELFKKDPAKKKLLAIFAHPDDECFLSSGLFLYAEKIGINTKLICLTYGERGQNALHKGNLKSLREHELRKSVKVLKINNLDLRDYGDGNLRTNKKAWASYISKTLRTFKPDYVLTFDTSGLTGHPDHIASCVEVLTLIKKMQSPPVLLWRVPDWFDKILYTEKEALTCACKANYKLDIDLATRFKKLAAILGHETQMPSVKFKIGVMLESLLNTREYYYKVDLSKYYKYKYVNFKID